MAALRNEPFRFSMHTFLTILTCICILVGFVAFEKLEPRQRLIVLLGSSIAIVIWVACLCILFKGFGFVDRMFGDRLGIVWGLGIGGVILGGYIGAAVAENKLLATNTLPGGVVSSALSFALFGFAYWTAYTSLLLCGLSILRHVGMFPANENLDGVIVGLIVGATSLLVWVPFPTDTNRFLSGVVLPSILGACLGYFGQVTSR